MVEERIGRGYGAEGLTTHGSIGRTEVRAARRKVLPVANQTSIGGGAVTGR